MEEIDELILDYMVKITKLTNIYNNCNDKQRLLTKIGDYRSFIVDLKRLKKEISESDK